jgi:DNA (cytosine-5)-methyltransferase 1
MKIGSLFSGIGGLELGLEWSGLGHTIWQVERNKYCLGVLEKHWPHVERYTDVKTVGKHNLSPVDLICGGFPCQDVSAAGKGAGLSGSQSGLWYEFLRIVKELRPGWVVVENVASGAKRWVDAVRGQLELEDYATFPVPLSAADCGAPHLRRRIFIMAHTDNSRRYGGFGPREKLPRGIESEDSGKVVAHTDGKQAQRAPESRKERNPWAVEPGVGRVANGVSGRVDRIKALGNAVVPQCAQVIGEFIKAMLIDQN